MKAIRFEKLHPCKKTVTEKLLPTAFARFLSVFFLIVQMKCGKSDAGPVPIP